MKIKSSAPARIDLSGGAADLFGKCTLCCGISLRTYTHIHGDGSESTVFMDGDPTPLQSVPLIEAVIARAQIDPSQFALHIHSDIPHSSGLGGSAALGVSLLQGLTLLQKKEITPYELAEQAQRAESDLGNLNGYQDWYAAAFGGILFLDFKGKTPHPEKDEPYAIVENLTPHGDSLWFVVANTKVIHDSTVSNRLLYTAYMGGNEKIRSLIDTLDTITRDAKKALVWKDTELLGQIIEKNQEIIRYFGRSLPENERLIQSALSGGALACKVTGAGLGGCIAALCSGKKMQQSVIDALLTQTDAVYPVQIDTGAVAEPVEE
jgi:mevalonate kinase